MSMQHLLADSSALSLPRATVSHRNESKAEISAPRDDSVALSEHLSLSTLELIDSVRSYDPLTIIDAWLNQLISFIFKNAIGDTFTKSDVRIFSSKIMRNCDSAILCPLPRCLSISLILWWSHCV